MGSKGDAGAGATAMGAGATGLLPLAMGGEAELDELELGGLLAFLLLFLGNE